MDRPDPEVIELRVHGVHGTPPEAMLGDPFPAQVDGDDVAQFFRARTASPGRPALEAFYWGRFTSGSPSRALWLLLAPFALLNLARYAMLLPRDPADRPWSARIADGVLRLLGLALTLTLVVNVAFVSLNVLVHQCAGFTACLDDNAWLRFAGDWPLGARLLGGAVPSVLLIVLLWWFGRQTFLYEPRGTRPPLRDRDRNGRLGDRAFWHTSPQAPPLRALHVAASCAVLGMLFAGFLTADAMGVTEPPWEVRWGLLGVGAIALVGTLVLAGGVSGWERTGQGRLDPVEVHPTVTRMKIFCVTYALVSGAVTVYLTWSSLPAPTDARRSEPLPGFEVAANAGSVAAAVLLIALFACSVALRLRPSGRAAFRHDVGRPTCDGQVCDGRGDPLPGAFRPVCYGFGGVVIAAVAILVAGGLSSGLAFWVSDLVGEPVADGSVPALVAGGAAEAPWGIELGTSYWNGALLWGCAAVLFALATPAVLTRMVRLPVGITVIFAGAGGLLAAALLALALGVPVAAGTAAGLAVLAAAGGSWRWRHAWRQDHLDTTVQNDYHGDRSTEDTRFASRGIGKVVLRWRLAATRSRYHLLLATVAAVGVLVVVFDGLLATLRTVGAADLMLDPAAQTVLVNVGAFVVTALAGSLVALGLRSWRNPKLLTTVGVLWDLLAFWPRQSHPICPPPYGGRATLELVERAKVIAGDAAPDTVVLSGHSQGSLICAAAVEVLATEAAGEGQDRDEIARRTLDRICLITYGSQLQWAYARFFPTYVGFSRLHQLYAHELDGRWRNIHRRTDPLGGPVLAWTEPPGPALPPDTSSARPRAEGEPPPEPEWRTMGEPRGTARRAQQRPDGAWAVGHEVRLLDPERIVRKRNSPLTPVRGHSCYYDDRVFHAVIVEVAAEVRAGTGPHDPEDRTAE